MSNTKLLIANYRKTMKDLQKEHDKSNESLSILFSRAENLASEDIEKLMLSQIVLMVDYNRIAKRYNKALTMGDEAKEVCAELKRFATDIRNRINEIADLLKTYDISTNDLMIFLHSKVNTNKNQIKK